VLNRKTTERRLAALPEPDLTDPDAPEWTAEMFAAAKSVDELPADIRDFFKRPAGRPRIDRPKIAVKLRLDQDVVEHFKSGGSGWQTRMNDALAAIAAKAR
jgi:uncharacterized protein (DUF4415 family)